MTANPSVPRDVPPATPDVLIIGGGIAGLTAAWELHRQGRRSLVLEASGRAGGVITTERFDGFVIDAGPDALLIQKPAGLVLCRELGLADRLMPTQTPRTAFIVKHGRLVPMPEAAVLGLPTRLGPFVSTPLFSWRGKARMALDLVLPARRDRVDESMGAFMRRRFGEEAVTWLAEPLLAGIHAGDVERLSMEALFPRLTEAERTRGSVLRALATAKAPASSQGAFLSLPNGIGEIVEALVAQLPPGTVRLQAAVTTIARHTDRYTVTLADGSTLMAPAVIVASPAWATAAMVRELDAELSSQCGVVRELSTATVAFGVRREAVRHPLRGSGFVVPRPERRTVMAGTFVTSKWAHRAPEGFALLRGFVGGAQDPAVLEGSDEAIAAAAWADLAARLHIDGPPHFSRVFRWDRATAQYEVGHQARVAAIDRRLLAHPGLFITGSSFRGSGLPDTIADARATAARAAAATAPREEPSRDAPTMG